MPFSVKLMKELDKLEPDMKSVMLELLTEIERNREESVTRKEFLEFARHTDENFQKVWKSIGELADAQKRTEERLEELAQAQKRTEERLEELAQAQKRTEERLEELAQAQKRTDAALERLTLRVDELAEAQKRTDAALERLTLRVDKLAEAQKRTDAALERLTLRVDKLAEQMEIFSRKFEKLATQVGGLSDNFGYGLEDMTYGLLKKFLKRDFNIEVEELRRENIVYSRQSYDEANIFGEGRKNGEKVYVVGEIKYRFGVKHVKDLLKLIERVQRHFKAPVFPVTTAYTYHPEADKQLAAAGIAHYWSYQLFKD